jgi:acyl-CoA thioesterase FadM
VFVDREERRPVDIPAGVRVALERLVVRTAAG